MKQTEKDKYTRENVEIAIQRITKELAKFVEDHIGQNSVSMNTQELHQKLGAIKELRSVLVK